MAAAVPLDSDDPVIASYDVFVTHSPDKYTSETSKLFVLQYPSHRSASKPYNAARQQKPTTLRMKPKNGVLEVEIPIFTQEYYNHQAGERFGNSLADSQATKKGGGYGLASGFSHAPAPASNINDVPAYDEQPKRNLETQTLGGKTTVSSERDPVYMLGVFQNGELHLTHVDGVVQMRPQLHHIDAEDEIEKRKNQVASGGRFKQGLEAPVKLETKAIELKLKSNTDDPAERNQNANVKLLRQLQAEQWSTHDWIDQDDEESWDKFDNNLVLKIDSDVKDVRSMISNDDWLDRMSAPRDDGKKGLRSKLKGRDRERARRKKVEHERRQLHAALSNVSGAPNLDSDSDLTDLSEMSDVEAPSQDVSMNPVNIKVEPALAPAKIPGVPDAVPVSTSPVRKRGRPKKVEPVSVDE